MNYELWVLSFWTKTIAQSGLYKNQPKISTTHRKSALARQNSGGAAGDCEEALFCLDFSLVRFFSSRKRNEHARIYGNKKRFIEE